ncbi:response regulator transcription factor [Bacillus sp. V3B]|uniref:LytR/AlgR family response regulator transcription factor n=1 Tax=Bacillus sp. V3B TaxID=2804915 RepID=UPI00210A8219|nr:LytTR family DNA-binding domain-containing protein [Bacillus sp. V3B]MCQ6277572.1 response regulator transcription factor [Bacillus sp. V3B]
MYEINILILDNEQKCINSLKEMLSHNFITNVYELSDVNDVKCFLQKSKIDLVFLNIELPNINALKLANELKTEFPYIEFVFIGNHINYKFNIYKYGTYPIDFLVKPINPFWVEKALIEYREKMNYIQSNEEKSRSMTFIPKKIMIKDKGSILFVNIEEINFVEKRERKCVINIKNNEEIECNNTLNELEEMLSSHNFFRPHQSFLIPISKIAKIKPDDLMRSYVLEIDNLNAEIRVSKNRYGDLKKVLIDSYSN